MSRGGVGAACQREGIVFLPLPVETLGGWHETAVQQIRKLAAALSRQTGVEESVATGHLYQKLSVHLRKGNSRHEILRRRCRRCLRKKYDVLRKICAGIHGFNPQSDYFEKTSI